MTYEVETAVFAGPLHLLVQLINRHIVDVTRVSISGIVDDYLEHLESEPEQELDGVSAFVLMTAMLMHLKARFLLPEEEPADLEEELALLDERDRLLARLLTFLTFQDVATVLGHRIVESARYVGRTVGVDRELGGSPPPALPPGVTPRTLAALVEDLTKTEPAAPEVDVDHLDLDLPSVGDAIEDIRARITAELESTFERLVAHCTRRVEVAAYFLAVLELARWGIVSVAQDEPSEIAVRRAQAPALDLAAVLGEYL